MKYWFCYFFVALIVSTKSQNLPCFNIPSAPAVYSVGTNPVSVIQADFNQDGFPDIATANNSSNDVSVLKGNGSGGFLPAVNYLVGGLPKQLIANDFNNDGHLDIATANSLSNNVSILYGSSSGTFAAAINYTVAAQPGSLVSADFDMDGDLDIIASSNSVTSLSLLLGSMSGTFTTGPSVFNVYGQATLQTGDFNLDGKPDLAVASISLVAIYIGLGNGSFQAAVTYPLTFDLKGFVAKDLNADGSLDLIFGNQIHNYCTILLGSPSGSFSAASQFTVVGTPTGLVIEDFDGDSNLDLAAGSYDNISMLKGSGTGTFMNMGSFGDGDVCLLLLGVDVDLDGIKDIINVRSGTNTIRVYKALGNGNLRLPRSFPGLYNSPFVTKEVLFTDFNNDGQKDILLSGLNTPSLVVFRGSSTNLFNLPAYQYFPNATGLCFGELNNDSYKDLAIGSTSLDPLNILMGSASATFGAPTGYQGNSINSVGIVIADFDEDGDQDLVVPGITTTFTPCIKFYSGSVSGSLSPMGQFTTNVAPLAIVQADFNGDNHKDVAVTGLTKLSILLGTGTGSFLAPATYTFNNQGDIMFVKDLNGDSNPDIAILSSFSGLVHVFSGSTSGTFSPVITYTVPGMPKGITAGDFNSDGLQDLVTANSTTACLSFLLGNASGTFSPAYNLATGVISPNKVISSDFNGDNREDLISVTASGMLVLYSNNLTTVSVVGNATLCEGNTINLLANGAVSYSWSTGTTGNQLIHSPTITTTYSVTGTNSFGCAYMATKQVSVLPAPVLALAGGTVCIGNSFTLIPSGAATYTFYGGTPIISPTISATYSVVGSSSLGCISLSPAITSITAISAPLPIITVNSGSLCQGNSFTINPSGAFTYSVSGGSMVVSPNVNTSYTVTGTNLAGCVSASGALVTLTVQPAPIIQINSGVVCQGNQFTLNPSGAVSYTYSGGSAIVTPSATSSYSVIGTDSLGCVSLFAAVSQVTVEPYPLLLITSSQLTICAGESVTLSCTGAASYLWSTMQNDSSIVVSPIINTIYTVTGTSSHGCISDSVYEQVVEVCAGMPEQESAFNMLLFPNPGSGLFQLETSVLFSGDRYRILNPLGQVIKEAALKDKSTTIDISEAPAGLYQICLTSGVQEFYLKLVKQ